MRAKATNAADVDLKRVFWLDKKGDQTGMAFTRKLIRER